MAGRSKKRKVLERGEVLERGQCGGSCYCWGSLVPLGVEDFDISEMELAMKSQVKRALPIKMAWPTIFLTFCVVACLGQWLVPRK
jgi:hypothetical protein